MPKNQYPKTQSEANFTPFSQHQPEPQMNKVKNIFSGNVNNNMSVPNMQTYDEPINANTGSIPSNPWQSAEPPVHEKFMQNNVMAQAGWSMGKNIMNDVMSKNEIDLNTFPVNLFNTMGVKYYFDVEPMYVVRKLRTIFFPFFGDREEAKRKNSDNNYETISSEGDCTNTEKSLFEPDLYIPTMS